MGKRIFYANKNDDNLKHQLCKDNDYILLEPNYLVEEADLPNFLEDKLQKINVPLRCLASNIDVSNINTNLNKLDELCNIAIEHGGKCLSNAYLGVHKKHKFECKNGHITEMKAQHVRNGHWCKECSKENAPLVQAKTGNRSNNSTGFKGISKLPSGRWRAVLAGVHIGVFDTKEEAAKAYDDAAIKKYGENIYLNITILEKQ